MKRYREYCFAAAERAKSRTEPLYLELTLPYNEIIFTTLANYDTIQITFYSRPIWFETRRCK